MTAGAPTRREQAGRRHGLLRKVGASLATVAATGGLVAFATLGAFEDAQDPFPHAVLVVPAE
ncbi:hypothetical protein [Geodermatophilus sp. CPCC 206100]|uniref:hypothetical protein n=1 Tax=Geodermatophilus sp. CPCC 206100 TaxID=3020054 RepID=UPI003B0028D4